jgi:hypothetical protein
VLTGVRITVAGEGFKERTFLELLQERAAVGYATALRVKVRIYVLCVMCYVICVICYVLCVMCYVCIAYTNSVQ